MANISRTMVAAEVRKPDGLTFYTSTDCANALKSITPDIDIIPVVGTFYCTEADFLSVAKMKHTK